jgi:hypothetical protein
MTLSCHNRDREKQQKRDRNGCPVLRHSNLLFARNHLLQVSQFVVELDELTVDELNLQFFDRPVNLEGEVSFDPILI